MMDYMPNSNTVNMIQNIDNSSKAGSEYVQSRMMSFDEKSAYKASNYDPKNDLVE